MRYAVHTGDDTDPVMFTDGKVYIVPEGERFAVSEPFTWFVKPAVGEIMVFHAKIENRLFRVGPITKILRFCYTHQTYGCVNPYCPRFHDGEILSYADLVAGAPDTAQGRSVKVNA